MGKCVFLPQKHIKTTISSKVHGLGCVYVWGQGKRLLVELPAGVGVCWVTALDVPCVKGCYFTKYFLPPWM